MRFLTGLCKCDCHREPAHQQNFFLFSQHYPQCFRSGYSKFQLNQVISSEIVALDSRASKKDDLYSNYIYIH